MLDRRSDLLHRARRAAGHVRRRLRARRRPRWGNLRRRRPFSEQYGFDRGTPVDRRYLDEFFVRHAAAITGSVLEVRDPAFSGRFGQGVTRLDLVDIDPKNRDATIIADLCEAGSLPPSTYDCVIVPQTLQYVDDPPAAVANAWQALAPGGTLLVTVPCVVRLDPDLREVDRWRFTPAGLRSMLHASCPGAEVEVEGRGNLVTTMAFLLGLASEELRARELDLVDPDHAVIAVGAATRTGAST